MEEITMAIKTASDVMKFAKDNKVEIVDLKFCDVPGLWQHFSVSANEFSEEAFEEGIGFDGSSIRGFQTIDESDMLLIPDPESAFLDPFADVAYRQSHLQCARSGNRPTLHP
jgi:glutamine synthetase